MANIIQAFGVSSWFELFLVIGYFLGGIFQDGRHLSMY